MNILLKKRLVWWSNAESRADGVISVLAVIETSICVSTYWILSVHFGVTWHHWLILVIAPMVLMRSDESVKQGLAWFTRYLESENNNKLSALEVFLHYAIPSTITGITFILCQDFSISLYSYFLQFCLEIYIAVTVGIITITIYKPPRFIKEIIDGNFKSGNPNFSEMMPRKIFTMNLVIYISLFPICLGILLRTFLIRFFAVCSHPISGFLSLATNWKEAVWIIDIRKPPELIPGYIGSITNEVWFKSQNNTDQILLPEDRFSNAVFSTVLYGPNLVWRWSIKSTAWFYLPLLWVGRGWVRFGDPDLLIWGKAYCRVIWNWIGLVLAICLFALTLAPLVGWDKLIQLMAQLKAEGAPFSAILTLFVLDWGALKNQPWYWFYLPSWFMTFWLFFTINQLAAEISVGGDETSRLMSLRRCMWVSNVRFVFTNIGLGISLIYVLRAVDAWGQVKAFFSAMF